MINFICSVFLLVENFNYLFIKYIEYLKCEVIGLGLEGIRGKKKI